MRSAKYRMHFIPMCLLCVLLSGVGFVERSAQAQSANTLGQTQHAKELEVVPTQGPLAGKTVYTNSLALVVGCGKYPHLPADKQLDFARKDALATRAMLIRSYGFLSENITLLLDEDATKHNIEEALNRFTDKRFIRPTDRLFVYFSGHGQTVPLPGEQTGGFLIPTDATINLDKPNDVEGYSHTCVSMQKVRAFLEDSPARCCLVAADACFSGFLVRGKGGAHGLEGAALTTLLSEPAYQVLTAGGRGQQAWEDPQLKHSVFTYALLQALQANAGEEGNVLLTTELGAGIKRVVLQLSGGKQTPQAANLRVSEGEFLFVATAPRAVPQAMSGLTALAASANRVMSRRAQAAAQRDAGNTAYDKKDYVEAERLYKKAIELDPSDSDAYNNLGVLNYKHKKDYVEAERLYRKAIELDPNNSGVYLNFGNLNSDVKKDYVEAERLYKKAIELAPSDSGAYNNLGILNYNIKKDYVEAERLFRKTIELAPSESRVYTNLGMLHYNIKKDYVEAERLYKKAIELDPNKSLYHADLALALLQQEKREAAVKEARRAQELGLKDHPVYKELGL